MSDITRLNSQDPDFDSGLERLLDWEQSADPAVESVVRDIIADLRGRGDAALLEYTTRFDRWTATAAGDLERSLGDCQQALEAIDKQQREALEQAAARVLAYAEHQKRDAWAYT